MISNKYIDKTFTPVLLYANTVLCINCGLVNVWCIHNNKYLHLMSQEWHNDDPASFRLMNLKIYIDMQQIDDFCSLGTWQLLITWYYTHTWCPRNVSMMTWHRCVPMIYLFVIHHILDETMGILLYRTGRILCASWLTHGFCTNARLHERTFQHNDMNAIWNTIAIILVLDFRSSFLSFLIVSILMTLLWLIRARQLNPHRGTIINIALRWT